MNTCVLIFQSVHYVIKAEKVLIENNILYKIIPVPKHISSECGMAIEIESSERESVIGIFQTKPYSMTIHEKDIQDGI